MLRNKILTSHPQNISSDRWTRFRQRLHRLIHPAWLGTVRRTTPLSYVWGFDRGKPVDRYYIERFLDNHRHDIHGHVLEVKDSTYTEQFGTGVEYCGVLDIDASNPNANLIADLAAADEVPPDQFDCFILTQTLQFIYNKKAAIFHAHRLLRPGGVLLATVPAVSKLDRWLDDYWRFTPASCTLLFGAIFGRQQVTVKAYGNVLSTVAFLTGMATEELSQQEMDICDPYFPLVVAIRAVKAKETD